MMVVVVVVVVVGEGRQSMSQIIAAKSTNGLGEGKDTGRPKIKSKGQAPGGSGEAEMYEAHKTEITGKGKHWPRKWGVS
jgi:hypothetical protein